MNYSVNNSSNLSVVSSKKYHHFYDFNHKNIALIVGVFAVLVIFMAVQGVLFKSADTIGLTLGHEQSVFATNTGNTKVADSGQQPAVLGASTLSPEVESQMSSLAIIKGNDDTVGAGQIYAQQVAVVVNVDKNSHAKLASDLIAIATPPSLENYQRLVITRAQLQAQLVTNTAGDQTQTLQDSIAVINQKILDIQSNFASQGINLPS